MRFFNYAAAVLFCLILAEGGLAQVTKVVDCSKGKSITDAVSTLDQDKDYVVEVSGTCNENVVIENFEGKTLQIVGTPSAAINGVDSTPRVPAVRITASRRVRLSNLTVNPTVDSPTGNAGGINMALCRGCVLDNVTINADRQGMVVGDSQAGLSNLTVNMTAQGTALAVVALSDVSLTNFDANGNTSPLSTSALVVDGGSRVRLNYTAAKTLENFSTAILVRNGAALEGPNLCGTPPTQTSCLTIRDSNLGLRVTAAQATLLNGVTFDDNGDGIIAENGSIIMTGPLLTITGSTGAGGAIGNGITATHNSHVSILAFNAAIGGPNVISGNAGRGIAVASSSSLQLNGFDLDNFNQISGNISGVDIACDATSLVTGVNTLPAAAVISCVNQNPAPIPLP